MALTEKFLTVGNSPANLKKKVWYTLAPTGNIPSSRVGHTATYIKENQTVVFIGGAIPDSLCDDVWILDLCHSTCSKASIRGDFDYRYEHCTFDVTSLVVSEGECIGTKIWVFAGANMSENKNDLWELDVENLKWNKLTHQGDIPSKRTLHASWGPVNQLLVFGGGSQGAQAVSDPHVYQLDVNNRAWSVFATSGNAPAPRHGHVFVTDSKNTFYVHGGLDGTSFYDDFFIMESNGVWKKPSVSECKPDGRASHGGVFHGGFIYILGGWTKDGVANDFWRINIKSFLWERITMSGSSFPARLDFAMTLVELPEKFCAHHGTDDSEDINSVEEYLNLNAGTDSIAKSKGDQAQKRRIPFILIHGGMDDKGMLYEDFLVYKLDPIEDVTL